MELELKFQTSPLAPALEGFFHGGVIVIFSG